MGTAAVSDREDITAALDRFEAAQAEVAALSLGRLKEAKRPSARRWSSDQIGRPAR
jgi:hypothetical protein